MVVKHAPIKKSLTVAEREALLRGANALIEAFFDEWPQVKSWHPESVLATWL